MLNAARRTFDESPINYPREESLLDAYSPAVATVVERVGPAVVRVENVDQNRRGGGVGSGVIIAGDGLLTNSHVIGGTKRVRLATESGEAEAQVLGDDPDTDLTLLRAELASGSLQQRSATRKFCVGASSSSRSATRSASSPRSRPGSSRRSGDLYAPKADG